MTENEETKQPQEEAVSDLPVPEQAAEKVKGGVAPPDPEAASKIGPGIIINY